MICSEYKTQCLSLPHTPISCCSQAKTIREFDERFTSIMFGYPTNDDYYRDASPIHRLKSVQVPMLCLNAADDVFSPNHGEAPHSSCFNTSLQHIFQPFGILDLNG